MLQIYRALIFLLGFVGVTPGQPEPPYTEYAKMARYIVHKSDWTAMGTVSTLQQIKGFPMVNIISVADSPRDSKSTGHIYFLLTDLDYTAKDLEIDNKLTALFSNDQDLACSKHGIDPMEPICGRVIISGKYVQLKNDTNEYRLANESFISRHPASVRWIRAHSFFLCTLDIEQIAVLDYYGGPHYVTPEDYYNANFDKKDVDADANDEKYGNQRVYDQQSGENSVETANDAIVPTVIRPKSAF